VTGPVQSSLRRCDRCDLEGFKTPAGGGSHPIGDHGPGSDLAAAVGDLGAVETELDGVGVNDDAEASLFVVGLHHSEPQAASALRHHLVKSGRVLVRDLGLGSFQWTIFAMGSSMMSVAPRSLRAGIKMLMSDLGTTASTA